MSTRVQALGTAMPDHYVFKQSEIVEAFFARQPGWDPAWAEVFAASGVERRASVVDPSWYARPRTTADRMREFAPAARRLGAEAARRALDRAGPGTAGTVAVGDRARVVLPDNSTTAGKVTRIGTVAGGGSGSTAGEESESTASTIPVYVKLERDNDASAIDEAPVQVEITTDQVKDALSVPVTALLARAGTAFVTASLVAGR